MHRSKHVALNLGCETMLDLIKRANGDMGLVTAVCTDLFLETLAGLSAKEIDARFEKALNKTGAPAEPDPIQRDLFEPDEPDNIVPFVPKGPRVYLAASLPSVFRDCKFMRRHTIRLWGLGYRHLGQLAVLSRPNLEALLDHDPRAITAINQKLMNLGLRPHMHNKFWALPRHIAG